ncbi:hypothetical protein FHR88_005114 [Bradyrhizobium betae]|nr:hypothetical protein [Bradyrhizobium betae]
MLPFTLEQFRNVFATSMWLGMAFLITGLLLPGQ